MSTEFSSGRRRLLKTLFCSSVLMELNLARAFGADEAAKTGALDLLAVGDFGSGDERQKAVARAMAAYAGGLGKETEGLLLLGDNFYGRMPGGVKSPRWRSGFSDMYPGSVFPGPCWAVLGNHDYRDTKGNEQAQLGYAASLDRKTRWTMPGKYYRVDLPAEKPLVTFLMIDTNWERINRRVHGVKGDDNPCWMGGEEKEAQMEWLKAQLKSKRAPFTVVVGHHPVYSDGKHKDTPELVKELGPLLQEGGVHLYLCGHDHDLQHLELEGLKTSFVISGGGGARLYEGGEARKGSVVKDVHGFSHLSFTEKQMTLKHLDANGRMVHGFAKGVDHRWKVLD